MKQSSDFNALFEVWRAWFLGTCVKKLVYENLGLSPLFKNVLIFEASGDFLRSSSKNESSFINKFANLCADYGFDPRKKEHVRKWYEEDGALLWGPVNGRVGFIFAKECYNFYFSQLERVEKDRERIDRWEKSRRAARRRKSLLDADLAKGLLYILEKLKGNRTALTLLGDYLSSGGRFESDVSKILGEAAEAKYKILKSPQSEAELPPSLQRIIRTRGKNQSSPTQWANHLKQELLRVARAEVQLSTTREVIQRSKKPTIIEIVKDIERQIEK